MTLRSRVRAVAAVGAVMLAAALVSCTASADSGSTKLRIGSVFAEDSTQNEATLRFENLVEERTDGEVTVDVFPAGQIGSDETLGQDVSRGALEMAFINPGSLAAMDPLLDFHYLPYIVDNFADADKIFYGDGIIPQTLHETLADHGMRSLGEFELEFRAVTNSKQPVTSVDDLDGLKLRVPGSAAIRGFFDAAGTQTVVMPFTELTAALEQGTVDGQDNGVMLTEDNGLTSTQNHLTETRHVYAVGSIVIGESTYDELSAEQQDIVERSAQEVAAQQIRENRARASEYLENLEHSDIEIARLSEEQRQELRQFGLDQWDSFADIYGAERIEQLRKEVDAL